MLERQGRVEQRGSDERCGGCVGSGTECTEMLPKGTSGAVWCSVGVSACGSSVVDMGVLTPWSGSSVAAAEAAGRTGSVSKATPASGAVRAMASIKESVN